MKDYNLSIDKRFKLETHRTRFNYITNYLNLITKTKDIVCNSIGMNIKRFRRHKFMTMVQNYLLDFNV